MLHPTLILFAMLLGFGIWYQHSKVKVKVYSIYTFDPNSRYIIKKYLDPVIFFDNYAEGSVYRIDEKHLEHLKNVLKVERV